MSECAPLRPSAQPSCSPLRWERTFPGRKEQVGQMRAALRAFLTACPATDDAVLLTSELAANAIAHSASGRPGGTFAVRAHAARNRFARIEVQDQGSTWDGDIASAEPPHGLFLLRELAADYGAQHCEHGWVIWFTIVSPDGRPYTDQP